LGEGKPSDAATAQRPASAAHRMLAGRLGIGLNSDAVLARWGFPLVERTKPLERGDLEDCLLLNICKDNPSITRRHPELPGVDLTEADILKATELAIAAQCSLLRPSLEKEGLSSTQICGSLASDVSFQEAARGSDALSMLRLSIEKVLVAGLKRERSNGGLASETDEAARADVCAALILLRKFHGADSPEDGSTRGTAQDHLEILRKRRTAGDGKESDYTLALQAVSAVREGKAIVGVSPIIVEGAVVEEPTSEIELSDAEGPVPETSSGPEILQPAPESPGGADVPEPIEEPPQKPSGSRTLPGLGPLQQALEPQQPPELTDAPPTLEPLVPELGSKNVPEYLEVETDRPRDPAEKRTLPGFGPSMIEPAKRTGPEIEDGAAQDEMATPQTAAQEAAPSEAEMQKTLPKFDFPFGNMAIDPGLESYLDSAYPKHDPSGKAIPRNSLIRKVSRALFRYTRYGFEDKDIDPRCIHSVTLLRESFSPQLAGTLAQTLVDRGSERLAEADSPAVVAFETDMKESIARFESDLSDSLNIMEKDLIAKATGAIRFDHDALTRFLSLHPGKRELALQRAVDSSWARGTWRTDIWQYGQIRASIYARCGLSEPTPSHKLEAVTDLSALSRTQKHMVASFFSIGSEKLTPEHIGAFGIWLRADPQELRAYWEREQAQYEEAQGLIERMKSVMGIFNLPDAELLAKILGRSGPKDIALEEYSATDKVEAAIAPSKRFKERWFSTPKEERMLFWRKGKSDLLVAAGLIDKLRFRTDAPFTNEERHVSANILQEDMDISLIPPTERPRAGNIISRSRMGDQYAAHMLILLARPYMDKNSLLLAAERQAEFRTLADFLGAKPEPVRAKLTDSRWATRGKVREDGPKPNEDSCSSIDIELPDRRKISLDMIADGMGGHKLGSEDDGPTNGQKASEIAKEVFEICAFAGWVRGPEDARLVLTLADLAIVREQISCKVREDERIDMGTTMTIAMQDGERFYGIHAGDSDWKIVRDGHVIVSSVGHSSEAEYYKGCVRRVKDSLAQRWKEYGHDIDSFSKDDLARFEETIQTEAAKLYRLHDSQHKVQRNGVSSALGQNLRYLHINNSESGFEPIILEEGDIIVLCSDGIGVPICDHEFGMMVSECDGDLRKARDKVIDEAVSRVGKSPDGVFMHSTSCDCGMRRGKPVSDDTTIMMRYAFGKPKMKSAVAEESAREEQDGGKEASKDISGPALDDGFSLVSGGPAVPSLPEAFEEAPEVQSTVAVECEVPVAGIPPVAESRAPVADAPLERQDTPAQSTPLPKLDLPKAHFGTPTAATGQMLKAGTTRYLEDVKVWGSNSVEKVAAHFGISPRDLEVTVFYAYGHLDADFTISRAIDPEHFSDMIPFLGSVPVHLSTNDCKRILRSSYLLYVLREKELDPGTRAQAIAILQGQVSRMNHNSEYAQMFQSAVGGLILEEKGEMIRRKKKKGGNPWG
jgi:serine/threonine protein phosphatase PrpC